MISVQHDFTRALGAYKIKVNDPGFGHYAMYAANLDEVCNAIRHYFQGNSPDHDEANCPACRRAEKECKKLAAEDRRRARRERGAS